LHFHLQLFYFSLVQHAQRNIDLVRTYCIS
jgi:hypothetical protein